MQRSAKKPVVPPVNLYISEVWVLFVGHGRIETLFSDHQAANPVIKKVAKYGMRDPHMLYKISLP